MNPIFGLFILIYLILQFFKKNPKSSAFYFTNSFLLALGSFFFLLVEIYNFLIIINEGYFYEQMAFINRALGAYYWAVTGSYILFISLPFINFFKEVRTNKKVQIVLCLLLSLDIIGVKFYNSYLDFSRSFQPSDASFNFFRDWQPSSKLDLVSALFIVFYIILLFLLSYLKALPELRKKQFEETILDE